jgi:hypothetical protein
MLIILMVILNGVAHPTWAWVDENRYNRAHILQPIEGDGTSARRACEIARATEQRKFPRLQFICMEQS